METINKNGWYVAIISVKQKDGFISYVPYYGLDNRKPKLDSESEIVAYHDNVPDEVVKDNVPGKRASGTLLSPLLAKLRKEGKTFDVDGELRKRVDEFLNGV